MQDFSINVSICQDLDPPGGETDPPSSGGDSGTDDFFQLNLWTKRVLIFFGVKVKDVKFQAVDLYPP